MSWLEETKRYLGDGVYARWDGYQVWLSLDGQDATNHPTRIAMEDAVLSALQRYREDMREKEAQAAAQREAGR